MTDTKQPKLRIPRKKASLEARKARNGYLFVLPFLIGIVLVYLPMLIDSVWISFYHLDTNTATYVFKGLTYYKEAFTDSKFIEALLAGLQELVFEVPAVVIFSLFIAVVLNQKMLGRAVFRAIFFVPVIISTGIMEVTSFETSKELGNDVGIDNGAGGGGAEQIISVLDVQKLFGSMKVGGELVTYVVQIVNNIYNIINYSGVQMLIFLAGLQSISPAIYEACQIEGATGWETFWKITFPMISPMILVNAVYSTINAFTRSTNTVMLFINKSNNSNLVAAMSWSYFLIVILIIAAVAGIASSFIFYQRRD
jgi:ABC-type sugar transport system permease subunit